MALGAVLANPDLSELTFTRGRPAGRRPDGSLLVAREGRWQVLLFRPAEAGQGLVVARLVLPEKDGFVSRARTVFSPAGAQDNPFLAQGTASDPTEHATFAIPATERLNDEAQWTDLHYSELDSHLPQASRRVAVSMVMAIVQLAKTALRAMSKYVPVGRRRPAQRRAGRALSPLRGRSSRGRLGRKLRLIGQVSGRRSASKRATLTRFPARGRHPRGS